MELVAVFAAVIGGGGIGLFLMTAHQDRAAAKRRAYEKEMAEDRDLYAALAIARRLRSRPPSEDGDALPV